MIMKGLHITYDEGLSDPKRLAYFIRDYGFEKANPRGRYNNHLIVTDATHPVQDFVKLLHASGCTNIRIHTKNYAHYITLISHDVIKKMNIVVNYKGNRVVVPGTQVSISVRR